MTDKAQMIVAAATQMFARYGFAKTTMGDIAAQAGVARQTLYNAFPGKDEILRAVVRQAGIETYDAVQQAWTKADTVADKLLAFHTLGPLKWFEAIRAAPDWAELMEGMHKAASEEMKVQDAQWRAAFGQMLKVDVPKVSTQAGRCDEIVDFFYSTSLNAKHGVSDLAQLQVRLGTIRSATLALLNE